jgi:polysaccharide export outer membrane protein
MIHKTYFIASITIYMVILVCALSICTAQEEVAITNEPVVVAPSGLAGKEQAQLERQYRFEVRNKDVLLSPYVTGSVSGESLPSAVEAEESEQAMLYRYFGVAMELYERGRLEEALEILMYIHNKNPADKYVESYIEKIDEELRIKKTGSDKLYQQYAARQKQRKVEDALMDGEVYYKRKDYDNALLKFADVLALDPNNKKAKAYMKKLKDHYMQELQVEGIVEEWESKSQDEKRIGKIEDFLDNVSIVDESKAKKLLDDGEMEYLIIDKRADDFLDKTELSDRVQEIIVQQKEQERRSHLFTLGPGDVIQISVRDHPELSGHSTVGINGEITLPLTNDIIKADGLTLDELTKQVSEVMARYVAEPNVSITIIEYKSKLFYVIDEAGCTPYPLTRPDLTLRDALFIADWGDNRALGRVLVVKPSKVKPIVKKVDAFDIIYRGNLSKNIRIENGDVIYIPMTAASKITKSINDAIQPFTALNSARSTWLTTKYHKQGWQSLTRFQRHEDAFGYGRSD